MRDVDPSSLKDWLTSAFGNFEPSFDPVNAFQVIILFLLSMFSFLMLLSH